MPIPCINSARFTVARSLVFAQRTVRRPRSGNVAAAQKVAAQQDAANLRALLLQRMAQKRAAAAQPEEVKARDLRFC